MDLRRRDPFHSTQTMSRYGNVGLNISRQYWTSTQTLTPPSSMNYLNGQQQVTLMRSQHQRRFNVLSVTCRVVRPQAPTESPLLSSSMEEMNCYDTDNLFTQIWSEECATEDALIVHIYKHKGDQAVCDNHWGISLLSVAGKILACILLNGLKDHVDSSTIILESQCGFRAGRGVPSVLWRCWLGDRNGMRPVKNWMLVCWWWWFDWSFARLIAAVVQLSPQPPSSFASINTS